MQRPADMRVQGWGYASTGKIGPALVELNECALDLLLVRLLRDAGKRTKQESGHELHESILSGVRLAG
jgi:hypothetical protein